MKQVGKFLFPNPEDSPDEDVAFIGADLNKTTLLEAYPLGFFPWHTSVWGICWYNPNPRMVVFPEHLHISKSMRPYLNGNRYTFRLNTAFSSVVEACSEVKRVGQSGTWIWDDYFQAMLKMHEEGYAFSAETWEDDVLVGGAYGLLINGVFHGESMFSKKSNASKFAFIKFVQSQKEIRLIDCQVPTQHLQSLGGKVVGREDFLKLLNG